MNGQPPEHPNAPSRSKIMALTLLAEVVGAVLIVAVLPFTWSVRVALVAVYLGAAHYASLAYLRRRGRD